MPIITIMQTTEPSHPMPYQSIQHPVNIYELVFRGCWVNLQHSRIENHCQILNLPAMASGWSNSASHILANEGSYSDFLERLLSDEIQARTERTKSALKLSSLPTIKTLEQYDFKFASGAPRAQLYELAWLGFIERSENIAPTTIKSKNWVGQNSIAELS
jgi:hypothetical protein